MRAWGCFAARDGGPDECLLGGVGKISHGKGPFGAARKAKIRPAGTAGQLWRQGGPGKRLKGRQQAGFWLEWACLAVARRAIGLQGTGQAARHVLSQE